MVATVRNFLENDEKGLKSCKNTPKQGKIPTFYSLFIFLVLCKHFENTPKTGIFATFRKGWFT